MSGADMSETAIGAAPEDVELEDGELAQLTRRLEPITEMAERSETRYRSFMAQWRKGGCLR